MRQAVITAIEHEIYCWPPFDAGRPAMKRILDLVKILALPEEKT
jgi:hypothetical protein